jgi:hypothetical protein
MHVDAVLALNLASGIRSPAGLSGDYRCGAGDPGCSACRLSSIISSIRSMASAIDRNQEAVTAQQWPRLGFWLWHTTGWRSPRIQNTSAAGEISDADPLHDAWHPALKPKPAVANRSDESRPAFGLHRPGAMLWGVFARSKTSLQALMASSGTTTVREVTA